MKRYQIKSDRDLGSIKSVAQIVRDGGVIAYPTDTIYGLGCSPFSSSAVERIYAIKGRSMASPLILLLNSAEELGTWCQHIPDIAVPLIHYWPAALTIILKVKPDLPDFLTRAGDSLAFRVPDSSLCRALVAACGGSLTSTSANRSNQDSLLDPEDIAEEFGNELDALVISLVETKQSSTIIDATGSSLEVVREGSFSLQQTKDIPD